MTFDDLPLTRLARQNISAYHFSRPQDVVSWMGAMQAQDYAMVQWALGVRLPGVNPGAIRDAINKG
ncbi:MAG: winged helix DNA-binding domain-containing protein, partial [Bacteroidota bacterium]|nr:winged helix DNA-binding domain-containing protein [Bacteroidota bacterium]